MKLSEYIKEFGDGTLVGIYDEKQIKQMLSVGKVKYIAIVEEDKVFVPRENEKFWYISIFGHVCSLISDKREVENILEIQQVYRTRAEAEFARDKAIFLEFMRKEFLRNSDELDWKNDNQIKRNIFYSHVHKLIRFDTASGFQGEGLYTTNKNWLEDFIDEHEDEIKKYYFEVMEG